MLNANTHRLNQGHRRWFKNSRKRRVIPVSIQRSLLLLHIEVQLAQPSSSDYLTIIHELSPSDLPRNQGINTS